MAQGKRQGIKARAGSWNFYLELTYRGCAPILLVKANHKTVPNFKRGALMKDEKHVVNSSNHDHMSARQTLSLYFL